MSDSVLKGFPQVLMRLQGGAFAENCTEALQECIQEVADACSDRGGKHKVTMTITLDVTMDQRDRVVEIVPAVSNKLLKEPKPRPDAFWINTDYNLTTNNPRQMTFEDELAKKRLGDAERTAAGAE